MGWITWITDRIVPRRYLELEICGSTCVMTWEDAVDHMAGMDPEECRGYTVRGVWMTRHRHASLPEFQGY